MKNNLLKLITLVCLLGVGFGQKAWADAQFDEVYIKYMLNGSEHEASYKWGNFNGDITNGAIVTTNFTITKVYMKYRKYNGNVCGAQLGWNYGGTDSFYGNNKWTWDNNCWSYSGSDYAGSQLRNELFNLEIANNSKASGRYTMYFWWQMWGSLTSSSDCSHNWYMKNNSNNYQLTYTILPPAVNDFAVSGTGSDIQRGSGTEVDPYIIVYGGSLNLSASSNKAHEDANSHRNYKFGSGSYSTTANHTISDITSTEKQSITVNARCINETASLEGAESSTTIYYKAAAPIETTYAVTINNGDHGTVSPNGEQQVGATGFSITATPADGYSFQSWQVTGGASVTEATEATTRLTATSAGTVTATYTEDLTTVWKLGYKKGSSGEWTEYPFVKKTGERTGSVAYYTATLDASAHYLFKVKKDGTYYGNNNSEETYWIKDDIANWTFSSTAGDCNMKTSVTGEYTFKIDFSAANPKVSVTFPVPDPSLTIAASAAAGTFYTGQTITLTPTTNQKGELTLCWTCVAKPDGAAAPAFSPVAGSKNFTTSADKAGEYVFSATIGTGECGGSYELLATAPNCTIQVQDIPYKLYIVEGAQDLSFDNAQAQATLEAGKEYQFKLHTPGEPGTWYTNCSSASDLNVMNATNNLDWPFNHTAGDAANTRLATTIAGTYTFTLTIGEGGNRYLSVTYPTLPRQSEMYANAVKEANTDVMIQAFYWAHDGNTSTDYTPFGSVKWADLDGQELGENFDLVWLAPSTVTADYTGYLPMNYSIQGELSDEEATATGRSYTGHGYHSPWGTEAQLKTLISNIHAGGGKAIADIVINHSTADGGSWCTWQPMKFGNATNNTLYGSYTPDWRWVTRNDEMFLSKSENQYGQKDQAGECGTKDLSNNINDDFYVTRTGHSQYNWDYTEYNCTYARDWAHGKREVREMSRAYLTWLKQEIGYDGWRYDFAKGFNGKYINDYNRASGACFSVSELFEGDVTKLEGFILDAGKNSYVFDFPAKYNLMNNAIKNGWYQGLVGNATNTMTYGTLDGQRRSRYAVTFVDNHDTFRENYNLSGQPNQMPNAGNQVLQAHAYILSMPGVPCVFYPYWHEFKEEIKAMVWARKWTGVNSESTVEEPVDGIGDGKYCAKITGTNGSIWLKLGPNAGVGVCPDGYTKAYSGQNVGVYYKTTDATIVKPILSANKESQDYVSSITITLSAKGATGAGYKIYYTLDGSEPTTSGSYVANGGSVTISGQSVGTTTTLKAFACVDGGLHSHILTHEFTAQADKLELTPNKESATVGQNIAFTLTCAGSYTLNYEVLEPGAKNYVTFATSTSKSIEYTLQGEGYYQFRVRTMGAPEYISNVVRVNAQMQNYYIRYCYDGTNWTNGMMTSNGDGTYTYFADAESTYPSMYYTNGGANVGTNSTTTSNPFITASNPDGLLTGSLAIWTYNSFTDELKVNDPNGKTYRLLIELEDGKQYTSNTVSAGTNLPVSFYATTGSKITLQYYGGGTLAWTDMQELSAYILENTVYTAKLHITIDGDNTNAFIDNVNKYIGLYYITTPGEPAEGSTPTSSDKSMTVFNPQTDNYFDHYYVAWMGAGQNTYGTVGNTINKNLAGAVGYYMLPGDPAEASDGASVRYAYNPATNVFTRTHLAGSTSGKFIMVFGSNTTKTDGTTDITSVENGQVMRDHSDWLYSTTICAKTDLLASMKIAGQYNGAYTYLLSPDGLDNVSRELVKAGNGLGSNPKFTIIYDYKTNTITAGWNPEGANINDGATHNVNEMLLARTNDSPTSEFTITDGSVHVVNHLISQITITKDAWTAWTGNLQADGSKTLFFWFSLPYTCRLSEVYGFGACNKNWNIQRYRGDLRAQGTAGSTAWRDLNINSTLEANRGYVLAINLKASDFNTITIDGVETSEISLFFPSVSTVTMTSTATATLPDWAYSGSYSTADIQRDWHVMGVPVMKSGRKMVKTGQSAAPFMNAYRWTWAEGGRWYEPFSIVENDNYFNFLPGHAYMVQGHGELTWSYDIAGSGSPLFAPQRATELTNIDMRINLVRDEEVQDKTYIYYRTDATREYEIGRDLEKIHNTGRAMIYSELKQELAAICLADTDLVQIPLTIVADQAGEYTLQLAYPVEQADPVLFDAQQGTTTLLNRDAYTIELPAGTCKDRFFLGVREKLPDAPTDLQGINQNEADCIVKYLDANGHLFILKQGHLFDAMGRCIR